MWCDLDAWCSPVFVFFCFLRSTTYKVNHGVGFLLEAKNKRRELEQSLKDRDALCRCGWSDNKQQLQREKKGQEKKIDNETGTRTKREIAKIRS